MTDTIERRVAIAAIDLGILGKLLNLPDGYEILDARPTGSWDPGIEVLISGPDLPITPPGYLPQRTYLRLDLLEGEARPDRVLMASVAP